MRNAEVNVVCTKFCYLFFFFLEKELQDFTHSLLLENDNSPFIIFIPEMNLF